MTRTLLGLAILIIFSPLARAQDMPLSQILIAGEGWKKGVGQPPAEAFKISKQQSQSGTSEDIIAIGNRPFVLDPNQMKNSPTAAFVTRDGGTVYIGNNTGDVIAYQVQANGQLKYGEPYCPIRIDTVRWKGNPANKPSRVSGLAGDKDGRVYAATELGVQVFDPTGRLCGVLTRAAPGKAEHLMFEGDMLVLWIAGQKYERKLNTLGLAP